MNQKGEFGQYILDWKMMAIWKFRKGPGFYLCCHNYGCYDNMVGKGGKAAVGGYWGTVMKGPHYVPPVLEQWTVNDVMDEWRCHASQGLLCTWWNECISVANGNGWSVCFMIFLLLWWWMSVSSENNPWPSGMCHCNHHCHHHHHLLLLPFLLPSSYVSDDPSALSPLGPDVSLSFYQNLQNTSFR